MLFGQQNTLHAAQTMRLLDVVTLSPMSGAFYAFPPVACAGLSPPVAFGVGFIGDDASADWDCCRCGGISLLLIAGLIANSVIKKFRKLNMLTIKESSFHFLGKTHYHRMTTL